MPSYSISIQMMDTAAHNDAVALIAPLGIDTEYQTFEAFAPPAGWDVTILAEARTRQRAAVLVPPGPGSTARLQQCFSDRGTALATDAYMPEGTALTVAAAELAQESRSIAARAGYGLAGISAIVADTSARFDYGQVPMEDRWYYGTDAVPSIACAVGNCIDINTFLVAALRSAKYEAAYLTCYFFDANPQGIASGMHCWVRTRHQGVVQDWDIAHFKKANRADVHATLNPIAGQRFALAYGRDHVYRWRGIDIRLSTPSRPNWVRADGSVVWGSAPIVTLTTGNSSPRDVPS